MENFTGSDEWLRHFKISRKSSSRKITKVISSKSVTDIHKIIEPGRDFEKRACDKLVNFDRCLIVNTDQSGFNYRWNRSTAFQIGTVPIQKV